MKKYFKWIGWGLLAVFLIAQFFQISKTNPEVVAENDFIQMHNPPEEVQTLLKDACYDCHSHETKYPWYTYIVPIGNWIGNHIHEGREHLNFSTWKSYSAEKADHKLEECAEEVEEKKMPLNSYTYTHSNARLDDAQRKLLEEYFEGLRS